MSTKWDEYRAAGRGDVLDSYLTDLSERVGLDPYYVELLRRRESGGLADPYSAESSAGALGPLQVMPETGQEMAKKYGFDYETEQGKLEAGVRYYKEQLERFDDPAIAAAAYHSGPARVQGILDRGGDLSQDLGPVGRGYYSWFNKQVKAKEQEAKAQPPEAAEPPQVSAPTPTQVPSLPEPPKVQAPTTEQLRAAHPDEELIRSMPWWQRGLLGFAEGAGKIAGAPGVRHAGELIGAPKTAMEHMVYGPLAGYDPNQTTLGGAMADPAMKAVHEATAGSPLQGIATGATGALVATGTDIASDPVVWAMTFAKQPVRALGRISPALARGAIIGLKGAHRLFQLQMTLGAAEEIPRGIVGAVNAPEKPEGWFQLGSGTISGYMVAHPFLKKLGQPRPYEGPTRLSVVDPKTGEWIDLRQVNPELANLLDRAPGTTELRSWINDITAAKWDLLKEKGILIEGETIRLPNVDIPEQHVIFGSGARGLSEPGTKGGRLGLDVGHLLVDIWGLKPEERPRALAELVHDVTSHEVKHLILESGIGHEYPAPVRQKLGALAQEFGLGSQGILTGPTARPGNFKDYYARRRAILEEAGLSTDYAMDTYERVSRAVEESIGQGDIAAIIAKMARVKDPQGFVEQFKVSPEEAVKGLDLKNFAKTLMNLEKELAQYQRIFPKAYLEEVQGGLQRTVPEILAETGGIAAPGSPGPRAEMAGAPPLPMRVRGTTREFKPPPRAEKAMEATGRGKERKRLEEEGLWENLSGVRPGDLEGPPRREGLDALTKQEKSREGETTKGAPPKVLHPLERGLRYELQRKEMQLRESARRIEESTEKARKIKEELGPGTVEKEISKVVDEIQMRKLQEFQERKKKGETFKAEGREEEPVWQRKRREAQEKHAGQSQRTAFMMGPPRYGSAYERDLATEIIPRLEKLARVARERNPLEAQVAETRLREARKELAALKGAKIPLAHVAEHFYAEGRGKEGPQVRTTAFDRGELYADRGRPGGIAREKAQIDKDAALKKKPSMAPRLRTQKGLKKAKTPLAPPPEPKIPLKDAIELVEQGIHARGKKVPAVNVFKQVEASKRTPFELEKLIARLTGEPEPTEASWKARKKAAPPPKRGGLAGVDWVKVYEGALAEKKAKGLDTTEIEKLLERERSKFKAEGRGLDLPSREDLGLKPGEKLSKDQWERVQIKAKWQMAKAAREYAEELMERGLTPREAWDYVDTLTKPSFNFIDQMPRLAAELEKMGSFKAEGRKLPPDLFEGAPKDRIETVEELMARAERNLKRKLAREKSNAVRRAVKRQQREQQKQLEATSQFLKEEFRAQVREQFKPPPKPGFRKVTPKTSTEILGDTFEESKLAREEVKADKEVRKVKQKILPVEEPTKPVQKKDFLPGVKVEHQEFGPGTVEKRRANGNVVVRFEDPSVGEKLMSPEALRLRKPPLSMKAEGRGEVEKDWMDDFESWAQYRQRRGGREELEPWVRKQVAKEAAKAKTLRVKARTALKGKDILEIPEMRDKVEDLDLEYLTSEIARERETSIYDLKNAASRSMDRAIGEVRAVLGWEDYYAEQLGNRFASELYRTLPDAEIAAGSYDFAKVAKKEWARALKSVEQWAKENAYSETATFEEPLAKLKRLDPSEAIKFLEDALLAKMGMRWAEANPPKFADWDAYREADYGRGKPIESGLDRGEAHKLVIPIDMEKARAEQQRYREMETPFNIPLTVEPTELRALDSKLGDPRSAKFWESWYENPEARVALEKNFNAWLGKEKPSPDAPVLPGGRPKLLFHGTSKPEGELFTRFHSGDIGYHLGDAQTVEHFLSMRGRSYSSYQLVAYPVFSNMKNPLRMRDIQHWKVDGIRDELKKMESTLRPKLDEVGKRKWDYTMEKPRMERLREVIELTGHDGIVYRNQFEGPGRGISEKYSPDEFKQKARDSYISWHPEQSKSAIYNIGEFSRTDPRLYRAEGRTGPIGITFKARKFFEDFANKDLKQSGARWYKAMRQYGVKEDVFTYHYPIKFSGEKYKGALRPPPGQRGQIERRWGKSLTLKELLYQKTEPISFEEVKNLYESGAERVEPTVKTLRPTKAHPVVKARLRTFAEHERAFNKYKDALRDVTSRIEDTPVELIRRLEDLTGKDKHKWTYEEGRWDYLEYKYDPELSMFDSITDGMSARSIMVARLKGIIAAAQTNLKSEYVRTRPLGLKDAEGFFFQEALRRPKKELQDFTDDFFRREGADKDLMENLGKWAETVEDLVRKDAEVAKLDPVERAASGDSLHWSYFSDKKLPRKRYREELLEIQTRDESLIETSDHYDLDPGRRLLTDITPLTRKVRKTKGGKKVKRLEMIEAQSDYFQRKREADAAYIEGAGLHAREFNPELGEAYEATQKLLSAVKTNKQNLMRERTQLKVRQAVARDQVRALTLALINKNRDPNALFLDVAGPVENVHDLSFTQAEVLRTAWKIGPPDPGRGAGDFILNTESIPQGFRARKVSDVSNAYIEKLANAWRDVSSRVKERLPQLDESLETSSSEISLVERTAKKDRQKLESWIRKNLDKPAPDELVTKVSQEGNVIGGLKLGATYRDLLESRGVFAPEVYYPFGGSWEELAAKRFVAAMVEGGETQLAIPRGWATESRWGKERGTFRPHSEKMSTHVQRALDQTGVPYKIFAERQSSATLNKPMGPNAEAFRVFELERPLTAADVKKIMFAEGRGGRMEASARDLAKELGEDSLIKGIRNAEAEKVKKMAIEHRPEFIRSIRRAIRKAVKDTDWENVGLEGLKQNRAKLPKDVREMLATAEMMGIRPEEFDRIQGIQKYDPLFEKLGAPRAIITSLDLSGILRQGVVGTARIGIRHPIRLVKMINRSIGALASEKIFKRSMEAVEKSADYDVLKGLGVDFARTEEQFGGAKYVEGVFKRLTGGRGNFVRMSERAYTYYLNRLRYELGKQHLDALRRIGFELGVEKNAETGKMAFKGDLKVYQNMAEWINIATGRGSLPKGQDKLSSAVRSADKFLNAVFFSPRLMLARIALLNPMTYVGAAAEMGRAKGGFKSLRAMMAIQGMDIVAYSALVAATMNGLKMLFPDAEFEDDMTSSDFGQVRMGRTRADITGGVRTYVTGVARLIAGETKTEYGAIKPQSGWRTLANFFRGKLGPMPSLAVTMIEGRNVIGEPSYGPLKDVLVGDEPITPEVLKEIFKVTGGTIAESAVIPMIAADAYNLIRDNEFTPLQLASLLSLATLGAGVTTREPPPGLTPLTQKALREAQLEPLQRPSVINTPFRDALGKKMELKLPYMVAKHIRENSDKDFYEMMDAVVRTPGFQNLPPAAQRIAITMLLTDARQARSPRAMMKWGSARIFPKVKENIYPKELRRLEPPPPGIPRSFRWTDLGDVRERLF